MPRLVDPKTINAALAALPNQFTMKELKVIAHKHKLNFQTLLRHGIGAKLFINLERGVYSRLEIHKEPPKVAPPAMEETVRHLGFCLELGQACAFPLPTFHVQKRLAAQDSLPEVAPRLKESLAAIEEEILQLRIDIAESMTEDASNLGDHRATQSLHSKPTTPKELRALAEQYGWIWQRQSGSHHIFKHPGRPDPLAIPCANSNKSIGARASRLIATQILRGSKGQQHPH